MQQTNDTEMLEAEAPRETDASTDELEVLRLRVNELQAALDERERLTERVGRECEEFAQFFPDVPLHGVPDEVWNRVRTGVPLSAAYALYETRCRRESEAASREQARVAALSLGDPPEAAGPTYFSPSQVRAMNAREVRENYDRIFESMRHWQ